MEIPTLTIESRKAAGSRAATRLRKQGKLPAVVYGHGQDPAPIALNNHEVEQYLKRGLHVVNLKAGNDVQPCQFKDAQYDHLGISLVHVDLMRVDLAQRIKVTVPLEFRGTPKGQIEGGILRHEVSEIEVECLVANIPHSVRVDVSGMALDAVMHVKDVELPEGVAHVLDPEAVVAVVRLPAAVAEVTAAPAEAGPAEPEVIGKGKQEVPGEGEEKK
ncbi:MAG TPA: 50S ribosomal protein L25 [Phycisphaerae bacterium]|nr:50S ribosomal protein L25 [Phycisphaerae bacterium]